MRSEFNHESESRESIGSLVGATVKALYDIDLGMDVLDEIEVLSLNDATINLVHIIAESFAEHIDQVLELDRHFVVNNVLNNTSLDARDCFLTPFVLQKIFVNQNNLHASE